MRTRKWRFGGGKFDTFRMLTHPGTSIIPGAIVAAEVAGASGKDFLTGVACGYEVMERMAAEFIPTVMSRGFHAGPVFSIFGTAVAAAKIMGLNEDQMNSAIALCASLAGGNLEGLRSGGKALREGAAVRNAMLAVSLAKSGHIGGETVLEGDAGFYHSYAGNNKGRLTYSFTGATRTNLADITANLGKEWMFLETLYRIYATAGYNIAHIDVTAKLCTEHNIRYEDVDRVEAVVNWMETQYPSPAFTSRREDVPAAAGNTGYFTALRRCCARFPGRARAWRRPRRSRCAPRSAGLNETGHHYSVASDDALRSAHYDFYQGWQKLYEAIDRTRVHLGLRRGGTAYPRRDSSAADSRGAVRTTYRDVL
jgi:hypothetical protein